MPRRARLDAPGTLHHVILRGNERCRIVDDAADRKNFVKRLAELSAETCQAENVSIEEIKGGSRRKEISWVRVQIAIGLVKTHGVALAEIARQLGVSTSAISKIIKRADYLVNLINNVPLLPILFFWSGNVTSVYFIQWILFGWGLFLFPKHRYMSVGALLVGIAALCVTHAITLLYLKLKKHILGYS